MTTLTWGNIPSIDKIGRQVEISKEVSSPNWIDLLFPKGEIISKARDPLFRRVIAVTSNLENEILERWDSLPEETRNNLEAKATAYFCKSDGAKKPAKRSLIRSLATLYAYGSAFYALATDSLGEFYQDADLLVEAHSNLMHTILDVADQAEESDMVAFLKFLEKDFENGDPKNCIPYTQEMRDRMHSLLERIEPD